jgi:hypothetical protein
MNDDGSKEKITYGNKQLPYNDLAKTEGNGASRDVE